MNQIAHPAGLRVLESLVQLVRNADEIEKVINEINRARDEANERIAVVGNIEDIERLRSDAANSLREAKDTLAGAKREADAILGKAGEQAAAERARQKRADEIFAAAEEREAKLDAREAAIATDEQKLQKRMDAARGLKADFNSLFE